MSDSANTNELESYGVWVKKPPRTVDSSAEEQSAPEESSLGAELAGIGEAAAAGSGEEEEIDLSEFGFDDSDDAPQAESAASGNEEEVDLSEFGFDDSSPDAADDSPSAPAESTEITETEAAPLAEEGPLDIDLSFDDSAPETKSVALSSGGGEEIDLSEFGFDDGGTAAADDGTESVNLSEFGFDDTTSEPAAPDESPSSDGGASLSSGADGVEEEIDLSEFGFDDSDGESDESDAPKGKDGDREMTVVVDDDFDTADESDSESGAADSAPEDDGFDIDSILNSVEDENGQTISLADAEGEKPAAEEKDAPTEQAAPEAEEETTVIHDIPDTFDEETSSLFDDESEKESASAQKSAPEEAPPATNDVLSQLMSVITSLKDEVASLKSDFEELKKNPPAKDEQSGGEPPEGEDASPSNGFFGDTDEDDTIALSMDELRHIEDTAEFVEEQGISEEEPEEESPDADEQETREITFDEPTISDDAADKLFEDDATLSPDELSGIQSMAEITREAEATEETEADSGLPLEEPAVKDAAETGGEAFEEPAIGEEELDFSNGNLVEPSLDDIAIDEVQDEEVAELPDEIEVPKVDDIFVESSATDLMEEETSDEFIEPEVAPEEIIEEVAETDDNLPEDIELDAPDVPVSDMMFEEPPVADIVSEDEIADEAPVTKAELNGLLAPDIEEELTEDNLSYLESDKPLASADESEPKKEPSIPADLTKEIKAVLSYMDRLLENLPEDKIAEFAQSEQFETYKKLFAELGLD